MKRSNELFDKNRIRQWNKEHKAGGFRCSHCKSFVVINDFMGTVNRNHCNLCLWSKHVDVHTGDRKSDCLGGMKPVGLTYKQEGFGKMGEIMLVHACSLCAKVDINRVARDDPEEQIEKVFLASLALSEGMRQEIESRGVYLLDEQDRTQLLVQLHGLLPWVYED